jgi:hypothetical protein
MPRGYDRALYMKRLSDFLAGFTGFTVGPTDF